MNLIIGKNGFIAQKLLARKKYMTTTSSSSDTSSIFFDLNDADNFDYSILNSNTNIILLAAISSPDKCNNEYEYAYKINVEGTSKFIEKSLARKARILFFSSDVVYGNQTDAVGEEDPTHPFGKYAEMKDFIEKKFLNEPNFKVFRLSYVLSAEDKYLKYLKSCIDSGETADIFHPFTRKVVYIDDLLDAIEAIIEKWNEFSNQKFNICGDADVSRKALAEWYNDENENTLHYKLTEPNKTFWEARPKNINIISHYLTKLLGRKTTPIQEAIKQITRTK